MDKWNKVVVPLLAACAAGWAGSSERIRIDQVGYAVGQAKLAISLDTTSTGALVDSATGATVFQATLAPAVVWTAAGDTGRVFDFSAFDQPGTYFVKVGAETSRPVHVATDPFLGLARGSVKAFWYNRCSYALVSPYAQSWARAAGHPDTAVLIHPSAATKARPKGTKIRSPGGWYDAGDYGKYVVNSGISTWTLLHLYESAPSYFDSLSLDVPAHGGPQSDLVDEILWNLRWMLSMQDPNDGGVYHKLTTASFSDFIMPSKDKATRYVVQKSTQATLDLAAVAAYAARLFRGSSDLPGFADSCQAAALSAWTWARLHPDSLYDQDTVNAHFTPAISTGTYADSDPSDEFNWAASELFLTTQADSFATVENLAATIASTKTWGWPGWSDVGTLGWLSLLSNKSLLTGSLSSSAAALQSGLLKAAKAIRDYRASNAYHVPQGGFWWGGNSAFANNGILLWKAWQVGGDTSYRNASLETLDYLLGRNATGYCFVTGFGGKSPMNPHHRPSASDGVVAPDPGFLVGGANSGQEDECADYPSTLGPKSYVDDQDCYSVNEVAINWNAPLAYLAGVWSASLESPATGIRTVASPATRKLSCTVAGGEVTVSLGGKDISRFELFDAGGRLLARVEGSSATLKANPGTSGLLFARVRTQDGIVASARVVMP